MTMMHLAGSPAPRRPYSDWLADCERLVKKECDVTVSLRHCGLDGYYNVGLSPREAVQDWLDETPHTGIWL